jgi:hypothetical protein
MSRRGRKLNAYLVFHHDFDLNGTTINVSLMLIDTGDVIWEDEKDPESVGPIDSRFGVSAVRWATTVMGILILFLSA